MLRILLVDDNVDAADSMGEILRALGNNVLVAHDPEQALAAAATFDPEVVVLDIGLPRMDGHQLADELRRLLSHPPRLIALSGFGQERDRQKSLEHGFAAHLVKPACIADLVEAIDGEQSSPA